MLRPSKKPIRAGVNPSLYHGNGVKIPRGDKNYVMNRSELVKFSRCPRKWMMGGFDEKTSGAMEHGSLVDCLLLTPGDYEQLYAVTPETYPSTLKGVVGAGEHKPWIASAQYCKDWEAGIASEGKTAIQSVQLNSANAAIRRLKDDPAVSHLLENSDFQVMVSTEWHDEETGLIVPLKCLIDIVPPGELFLADVKTAADASPRAYAKAVFDHGYHVQAALYMDTYNVAANESRTGFRHIISENKSPFEPAKRWLSEEYLRIGRDTYMQSLRDYCQCLASNNWPGYDDFKPELSDGGWGIVSPQPWMMLSDL